MKKKTLFAYVLLFFSFIFLLGSYFSWKSKLQSVHNLNESTNLYDADYALGTNSNKGNESLDSELGQDSADGEEAQLRLERLTSNQAESLQKLFLNRFDQEEKVRFLIFGSDYMHAGNPGYADRFATMLNNQFEDLVETSILSYDGTSSQLMNGNLEETVDFSEGYDVILFEPFTIQNNGVVSIEDEHEHILSFLQAFQEEVADGVLVLHPAQPIHGAVFYPNQVNALQSFAETENILYVNHWADWPDNNSDDLLNYLTENGEPNTKGAEVWSNALISFFMTLDLEEETNEQ